MVRIFTDTTWEVLFFTGPFFLQKDLRFLYKGDLSRPLLVVGGRGGALTSTVRVAIRFEADFFTKSLVLKVEMTLMGIKFLCFV